MFGYVRPLKPELLVRELSRYQSIYCGICKQIGRDYGQLPRLLLGYDLTLLAVLLLALSDEQPPEDFAGCITNPLKKRPALHGGKILELAAGLTILMAYHKAEDNVQDEHPVLGGSAKLAIKPAYRKARRKYPEYDQVLIRHLERLRQFEAGPPDLAAADVFGDLLGEVFTLAAPLVTEDSAISGGLNRFGQALGAWIYLLDAIDDREADCNNGSWNPFSPLEKIEAVQRAEELLEAREADMDRVAALLPYERDAGLMGNIVTAGLQSVRDSIMAGRRLTKF